MRRTTCPSLSRGLLESKLFGHVKGAFTGVVADTEGKIVAANGGTLYLDEIGDLPLEIQLRLLRLLQEREFVCSGPLIEPAQLTQIAALPHIGNAEIEVGGNMTLADLADEHIRRVLARSARLEDAAEIIGIDVATLYRKRRKWQQELPEEEP